MVLLWGSSWIISQNNFPIICYLCVRACVHAFVSQFLEREGGGGVLPVCVDGWVHVLMCDNPQPQKKKE